ncbi:hypothetical protein PR048_013243 [Dryococelus australis]|uniref:Uncharacterized protein n=1 Tax=Dryococelus australis TaxID=614101 RepID=A0ABQ9HRL3_9NEOP|nr:hypothetical protein PR048_013243 [Dryococelus australis]
MGYFLTCILRNLTSLMSGSNGISNIPFIYEHKVYRRNNNSVMWPFYYTALCPKPRSYLIHNVSTLTMPNMMSLLINSATIVLLQEDSYELEKALEVAKILHQTKNNSERFQQDREDHNILRLQSSSRQNRSRGNEARCQQARSTPRSHNCGISVIRHRYGKCPAHGQVCLNCNKLNHFKRMCRSRVTRDYKLINIVQNNDDDSDFCISSIYSLCTKSINIIFHCITVLCLLDSGAQANILSVSKLKCHSLNEHQFGCSPKPAHLTLDPDVQQMIESKSFISLRCNFFHFGRSFYIMRAPRPVHLTPPLAIIDDEFDNLKRLTTNWSVLTYFNPKEQITISVNASKDTLGATLVIVFGCIKFDHYIYSQVVKVVTHKSPISIIKKTIREVPPWLQRLMLKLQQYTINLNYVPGKCMYIADRLSAMIPNITTIHD